MASSFPLTAFATRRVKEMSTHAGAPADGLEPVLVEFMRSLGTGFDHDKAVIERSGAAESLERIDRLGGKGHDAQE
jgi:hypothetical protein